MKNKNVFLASLAFMVAVGSAFASMLTIEPVYVRALPTSTSSPTCVNTNVTCNDPGSFPCKLTIHTTRGSGANKTVSTDEASAAQKPYKSDCITILNSATSVNLTTDVQVFDLTTETPED